MAFQRNDVVLIPFPYTDLSATKTRPAVIVSSPAYHNARSELLLAYVSSQVSSAHKTIVYVLRDWKGAGLLKPSYIRPKLAAIEPTLIVHHVGKLSSHDSIEVDLRLRQALALHDTTLEDIVSNMDLTTQSAPMVQKLAEKVIAAIIKFSLTNTPGVDVDQLRRLLDQQNH